MKKYFLLLSISLLSLYSVAQNYRASINVGYGFYKHEDLKLFQSYLKSHYSEFGLEKTEEFPSYLNYSASIEYTSDQSSFFGLNLAYYTTGARNHAKDYSGELIVDMPINAYMLGGYYKILVPTTQKLKPYFKLEFGYGYSKLKIHEKLIISDEEVFSEETKVKSENYFIQPSWGFIFNLKKSFSLDLNFAYAIDFKGKMYIDESGYALQIKKDEYIYSNWSGIRISFGAAYSF